MEYQEIANLIDDNTLNQPSKFRTKNWVEINDESRGVYNVNSQIKLKTTMLNLVYVITVMHIFLLRELLVLITLLLKVLLQIILIKKQYLKIVLHLLIV